RTGPVPGMADPRLGTAGLYFLVTAVLIGFVGAVAARLVPRRPSGARGGAWLLLAGALVLTVPIMAVGQLGVLPLTEDGIVVSLALTGALLWAARWFAAGRGVVAGWLGTESWLPLRSVLLPGAAAGVALFLVLMPLGAVFHRLVPTPERFVLWVVAAALLLPFFAAFEAIVRRGGLWPSVGWGLLGRLLLLAVLVGGVAIHTLSPVIGHVL